MKFIRGRKELLALICLVVGVPFYGVGERPGYGERPEVRAFVEQMSREQEFEVDALMAVLKQAKYQQSVIDAISRPAEKTLDWDKYQDIFLTKLRIKRGREFIRRHKRVLRRAEASYGVPASVVVAILGVETRYGEHKGKYRVLDSLMTLGFDYPERAGFFRKELGEFLLLVREENLNITSLLGSYAGAMGYGQFIPSSYRYYAVDFDRDGSRDIWDNTTDGIGSVANYLNEHGWKEGEPVTVPMGSSRALADDLFGDALKPHISVKELESKGALIPLDLPPDEIVTPFLFNGKEGPEYWVGLNNFYVITRYNHSKLYAMAVYQLSEKIAGHNTIKKRKRTR